MFTSLVTHTTTVPESNTKLFVEVLTGAGIVTDRGVAGPLSLVT